MKQRVGLLLAAIVFTGCGQAASGSYFSPAAAVVDGQKVSEEKLSIQLRKLAGDPQTRAQFIGPAAEANRIDAKREILNQMIEVTLVTNSAAKLGVKVSQGEVQTRIEALEKNYGGRQKFDELLRQEGLFRSELDDLLREQILYQKVAQAVTQKSAPTDQDLLDYFEQNKATFTDQVRASHILVCEKFDENTRACSFTPGDETLAKDITRRARAGEDFAALAKQYTKDPSNREQGGDLGFFGRGRMTPDFEAAAFALANPGDISDPVKTEFGYHVIRLVSKGKSFDDSKEDIRRTLSEERQQQVYREWLTDRFKAAKIRVNPKFGRFDRTSNRVVSTNTGRQPLRGGPGSGGPGTP